MRGVAYPCRTCSRTGLVDAQVYQGGEIVPLTIPVYCNRREGKALPLCASQKVSSEQIANIARVSQGLPLSGFEVLGVTRPGENMIYD